MSVPSLEDRLEDSYPLGPGQSDILSNSGRPRLEYPLSPVQQGLLFHSLSAPEPGVYIQQMVCRLHEALDVPAFRRAWDHVVAHHSILRSCFRWEGVTDPLQTVYRTAEMPIEEQDWRQVPAGEQEARLKAFLEKDRRRG